MGRLNLKSFFFVIILTLILSGIILLFAYFMIAEQDLSVYVKKIYFRWFAFLLFFCFIVSLALVYAVQTILTKQNINQLYTYLPELTAKQKANNLAELAQQITNINQDKRIEINLLKQQEVYRRDFLGNISHELKTPIFSIQGFLLTLIEGGVNDKKIRDKYLNRINKSVERLIYIINDLDLISELEQGKITLNEAPFDLVALIRNVFELLEIKAERNDVFLAFDKNYPNPIIVLGDAEKLEQVFINLIANAINHSQKRANVTVTLKEEQKEYKVTISDNGMGIKQEHLSRIFERFYKADSSRNSKNSGSGLGLSIVKHILDAHNKKIEVASIYEQGATFTFYLNKNDIK